MDFLRATRPYLYVFYCLGLTPVDIQPKYLKIRFIRLLPIFMQISFALSSSILITKSIIQISKRDLEFYGRTELVFFYLWIFSQYLRTIVIFIQCIFFKSLITEITTIFQNLEIYFVTHFHYQILYDSFAKEYRTKVVLVTVLYAQSVTSFLIRCWMEKRLPVDKLLLIILVAYTIATFFHIIFYIEMLSFYIDQLLIIVNENNIKHNRDEIENNLLIRNPGNNHRMWSKLHCVKTVHFRLWEVSRQINAYFGWCIIVIFLLTFIDTIYSVYWLFDHTQREWAPLRIIRKWKNK